MTSATLKKTILANPVAPDREVAAFLAADEHWDGFAYYWRKLLPSNVYKILEALLEHTRFNARTWQSGNPPIPSHERLATLAGVSTRTVGRILARDAQGQYTYTYRRCVYHRVREVSIAAYETERARRLVDEAQATPLPACPWRIGDLVAIKRDLAVHLGLEDYLELGDLIELFCSGVEQRRRYDEQQRRWIRTTNAYHVAPIMPLPPTLEGELAYGVHLAEVRRQRTALTEEAAKTRAAADAPTSLNQTSCRMGCSDKLAEKDPTVSLSESSQEVTSISLERTSQQGIPIAMATKPADSRPSIGNSQRSTPLHSDRVGTRNEASEQDRAIGSDRPSYSPESAAPRRLPVQATSPGVGEDAEARKRLQAWMQRRTQIDTIIGKDVATAATLHGDNAPLSTRSILVNAFCDTEIPFEELLPALRLIDHRYNRVYGAGGAVIKTSPIAAWITVARSVIAKGRSWGFDFEAQDAEERRKAKVVQDTKAAARRGNLVYIQTPEYFEDLDE